MKKITYIADTMTKHAITKIYRLRQWEDQLYRTSVLSLMHDKSINLEEAKK